MKGGVSGPAEFPFTEILTTKQTERIQSYLVLALMLPTAFTIAPCAFAIVPSAGFQYKLIPSPHRNAPTTEESW